MAGPGTRSGRREGTRAGQQASGRRLPRRFRCSASDAGLRSGAARPGETLLPAGRRLRRPNREPTPQQALAPATRDGRASSPARPQRLPPARRRCPVPLPGQPRQCTGSCARLVSDRAGCGLTMTALRRPLCARHGRTAIREAVGAASSGRSAQRTRVCCRSQLSAPRREWRWGRRCATHAHCRRWPIGCTQGLIARQEPSRYQTSANGVRRTSTSATSSARQPLPRDLPGARLPSDTGTVPFRFR